jgi:hypothetical protein
MEQPIYCYDGPALSTGVEAAFDTYMVLGGRVKISQIGLFSRNLAVLAARRSC